jgi:uncharacterized membrane protein
MTGVVHPLSEPTLTDRTRTDSLRRPVALTAAGYGSIVAIAAVWTAAVGALAVWRHDHFLSHRYDLGHMVQAVWSTAHGRPLEFTDGATGDQIVRLAAHVDPILVLLVPFWWVLPTPETLILVQAAALAAGVYPVVRLALKHVGSTLGAAFLGLWYLAYPWVVWNALNDVHPITFTIPLLLYSIWFLDEGRLGRFAVFAGLALMCGELVGVTVAMLGVWYAIRRRQRRAGVMIAVAGTAWTAISLAVVIPALNDGRSSRFYDRFESVGGSPTGVLTTLFTNPDAILAAISSSADVRYLVLILFPAAFLALGEPLLLAAAIPQLGVNLLSDFWSTTQPMFQYVAPILAPVIAATILGIGHVPQRLRPIVAGAPLCAALVSLVAIPPVPGGQEFMFGQAEPAERVAAMEEAVALVPTTAAVTATNRLGGQLSARRYVYLFPERARADWAVLDTRDAWTSVAGEQVDEPLFHRLLGRFERDARWRLVFDQQAVRVYRRQE